VSAKLHVLGPAVLAVAEVEPRAERRSVDAGLLGGEGGDVVGNRSADDLRTRWSRSLPELALR
jgi:hypothetical protein